MTASGRAGRSVTRGWAGALVFLQLMLLLTPSFSATAAEEARIVIPTADSPSLGPKDAPVTIIKFTDYQ